MIETKNRVETEAIVANQRRTATAAQLSGIKGDIGTLTTSVNNLINTIPSLGDVLADIVTFIVVDDSGETINQSTVELTYSATQKRTIKTGLDGVATFIGVPVGVRSYKISADGYVTNTGNSITVQSGKSTGKIVELTDSE